MNSTRMKNLEPDNTIMPVFNLKKRKKQEMISLMKLKNKRDYLSKYNLAIRYLFLQYLKSGFDIQHEKVHLVFKWFCVHEMKIESYKIEAIINERHRLKYNHITPSNYTEEYLEEILEKIKKSSAERVHS